VILVKTKKFEVAEKIKPLQSRGMPQLSGKMLELFAYIKTNCLLRKSLNSARKYNKA